MGRKRQDPLMLKPFEYPESGDYSPVHGHVFTRRPAIIAPRAPMSRAFITLITLAVETNGSLARKRRLPPRDWRMDQRDAAIRNDWKSEIQVIKAKDRLK